MLHKPSSFFVRKKQRVFCNDGLCCLPEEIIALVALDGLNLHPMKGLWQTIISHQRTPSVRHFSGAFAKFEEKTANEGCLNLRL